MGGPTSSCWKSYDFSFLVTLPCVTLVQSDPEMSHPAPYPLKTGTINHKLKVLSVRKGGCESLPTEEVNTIHYYSHRWHILDILQILDILS